MMSGPSSEEFVPSRGWASVAASVQGDSVEAVLSKTRGCHVCFRRDQFLMYCPFLLPEVRQAIKTQRTHHIQQDRVVFPGRVNHPPSSPSTAMVTSGVSPRLAPQYLRSAYIPSPTWSPTPRFTNSGSSYPATV